MSKVLYVGLGGALGAACRYLLSLLPISGRFPALTLVTNLLGAVLIGTIVGMSNSRGKLSDSQILFWKTGVCGGFTTFSTFSLESVQLLESGYPLLGVLYIISSVLLCLIGVVIGRFLACHIQSIW